MKSFKFWAPVVFWAGVIFWFSTRPVHQVSEFYWSDFIVKKSAHLFEYSVLAILFYRALRNATKYPQGKAVLTAFIFVVLYGISDELHQSFTPGREPTLRDIIIDGTGGGISLFLIWKYLPKMPAILKNLARSLQIA